MGEVMYMECMMPRCCRNFLCAPVIRVCNCQNLCVFVCLPAVSYIYMYVCVCVCVCVCLSVCNCFKDRLADKHSCLNLYPCIIKVQSINQSINLSLSFCRSLCVSVCLCLSLSLSLFLSLSPPPPLSLHFALVGY